MAERPRTTRNQVIGERDTRSHAGHVTHELRQRSARGTQSQGNEIDPQGSTTAWGKACEAPTPIVLPARPFDLNDQLESARVPATAILVGIPTRGTIGDEADAALRSRDLEVAPIRIGHCIESPGKLTTAARCPRVANRARTRASRHPCVATRKWYEMWVSRANRGKTFVETASYSRRRRFIDALRGLLACERRRKDPPDGASLERLGEGDARPRRNPRDRQGQGRSNDEHPSPDRGPLVTARYPGRGSRAPPGNTEPTKIRNQAHVTSHHDQ